MSDALISRYEKPLVMITKMLIIDAKYYLINRIRITESDVLILFIQRGPFSLSQRLDNQGVYMRRGLNYDRKTFSKTMTTESGSKAIKVSCQSFSIWTQLF